MQRLVLPSQIRMTVLPIVRLVVLVMFCVPLLVMLVPARAEANHDDPLPPTGIWVHKEGSNGALGVKVPGIDVFFCSYSTPFDLVATVSGLNGCLISRTVDGLRQDPPHPEVHGFARYDPFRLPGHSYAVILPPGRDADGNLVGEDLLPAVAGITVPFLPIGVSLESISTIPNAWDIRFQPSLDRLGYNDVLNVYIRGCPGGTGFVSLETQNGLGSPVTNSFDLIELWSPGIYWGPIPVVVGTVSDFDILKQRTVHWEVTCPDGAVHWNSVTHLIDPSGRVFDENNNPVDDAVVTIYHHPSRSPVDGLPAPTDRSEFQALDPAVTPMLPAFNPLISGTDGGFAWDVLAGYYYVEATKTGCEQTVAANGINLAQSAILPVPPEQIGLELFLTCGMPVPNSPPTADAGGPYTALVGEAILFDGIGSFDPDGTIVLYEWDFESDGIFDFSSTDPTAIHTYISPFSELVTLRVADNDGTTGTATASVEVSVEVVNQPPVCSSAYPSVATLWPPNHQFVTVNILGVTDLDGDTTIITIDGIFQDEAVNAKGSGNTAPDGQGVGTATAEVRAERVGSGNGRVYHISFTADDGQGGMCSGEVLVGVPKSQGNNGAPVDDGLLHDSTALQGAGATNNSREPTNTTFLPLMAH